MLNYCSILFSSWRTAQKEERPGFLPAAPIDLMMWSIWDHEHPLVLPHVSHLRHVPLRTIVKLWHSEQLVPS